MKNWCGIEGHTTDEFIHWTEKSKTCLKLAKKFRNAYDKIVDAGLKDELEILISASYDPGSDDCHESYNEDI